MEIREIEDKAIWEDFLSQTEEKTFLQSWNWGEFNQEMGDKIWRLGIYNGSQELAAVSLVTKVSARRGTFLFCPHGPILKNPKSKIQNPNEAQSPKVQILNSLLGHLKQIAQQEKVDFIKFSPIWERTEENEKIFKNLGFRDAPLHVHPEVTWELDLRRSEDELLAGMRKTTRYLIRQGLSNRDLEIIKSQDMGAIKKFNRLYQDVAARHSFVPFSLSYLEKEFRIFQPDGQVVVFSAKYKGEIIASALIIFWSGLAFYHHSGSSANHPKIPHTYLLQWEVIKEAKKRGCKAYNFWGVAPTENSKHPWAGLSLFKKGFGGEEKKYVKTQDFPLSSRYWLNYLIEKVRKRKRGL